MPDDSQSTPEPTPAEIARHLRELAEFLTDVGRQSSTSRRPSLATDGGRTGAGADALEGDGGAGLSAGGGVDADALGEGDLVWTRALTALVPESQRAAVQRALSEDGLKSGPAGSVPVAGSPEADGTADGLLNRSANDADLAEATTATTPAAILPLG